MEIGEHITARLTDFYTPEKVEASDGVITGYGTGGHLVYVFSQDGEVMGGSFGEMHGRKINRLYRLAIKAKAPVIGFLDSSGLRVEEGLDSWTCLVNCMPWRRRPPGRSCRLWRFVGTVAAE